MSINCNRFLGKALQGLDWRDVLVLSLAQFAGAFVITLVFPLAPFMVIHFGLTSDEVYIQTLHQAEAGYYAGYIGSAFFIGRFISSYFWGWLADRFGRLKTLNISLVFVAVLSFAFAVSPTFLFALLARFVMGLLNGVVVIVKAMAGDITSPENAPFGMGLVGVFWGLGLILGPSLAGALYMQETSSDTSSQDGFWATYPFASASLVSTGLCLVSVAVNLIFGRETKDRKLGDDREMELGLVGHTDSRSESAEEPIEELVISTLTGISNSSGSQKRRTRATNALHKSTDALELRGIFSGQDEEEEEGEEARATDQESEARTKLLAMTGDKIKFALSSGDQPARRTKANADSSRSSQSEEDRSKSKAKSQEQRRSLQMHHEEDEENFADSDQLLTSSPHDHSTNSSSSSNTDKKTRNPKNQQKPPKINSKGSTGLMALLRDRAVVLIVGTYALYSGCATFGDEIFTLWMAAPVTSGGLGWESATIGVAVGVPGFALLLFQLFGYPPLAKRIGATLLLEAGLLSLVPTIFVLPWIAQLPSASWLALVIALKSLLQIEGIFVFTSIFLMINNSVLAEQRGKVNGLSMALGSLFKALGPLGTPIYAYSLTGTTYPLNSHFCWILVALLTLSCYFLCRFFLPRKQLDTPKVTTPVESTASAEV